LFIFSRIKKLIEEFFFSRSLMQIATLMLCIAWSARAFSPAYLPFKPVLQRPALFLPSPLHNAILLRRPSHLVCAAGGQDDTVKKSLDQIEEEYKKSVKATADKSEEQQFSSEGKVGVEAGGNIGPIVRTMGDLLALPTGEMLGVIVSEMWKPRVSLPAFFASTLVTSVAFSALLLVAFFDNADVRFYGTNSGLDSDDTTSKSVLLFGEVLKSLDEGYVEKVDTEKLFATAVEAMTASLDPYTEFENKAVSEDNLIRFNGRYAGVGLGIERDWVVDAQLGRRLDKSRFRVSNALEGYAWEEGHPRQRFFFVYIPFTSNICSFLLL
jgi:hypothetical protein